MQRQFQFTLLLAALLLFSCSEKEPQETNESKNTEEKSTETDLIVTKTEEIQDFDTTITYINFFDGKEDLKSKLQALAPSAKSFPFVLSCSNEYYYISSNQKENESFYELNPSMVFGLIKGDSLVLLPMEYERIGNPNMVAQNCVEFRKGNLYGLLDLKSNLKTEAYFEYIIPNTKVENTTLYGNRSGKWYSIDTKTMKVSEVADFKPSIQTFEMGLPNLNNPATWIARTIVENSDDWAYGSNIVLIPSYIQKLKVLGDTYFGNYIPKNQKGASSGTEALSMNVDRIKQISKNLVYFISFTAQEEMDVRGWQSNNQYLSMQNSATGEIQTVAIGRNSDYNYWCDGLDYKFLNDTLLEVHISGENDTKIKYGYNFENVYDYYVLSPEGKIIHPETNRKFSFTKFVYIDETYFQGCFCKFTGEEFEEGGAEIVKTAHLSLEDLDVMRNEIFAEYGYIFKSEKWQKYFKQFDWYQPKHENVDDQLSEMDKANIKVIVEMQKQMKGQEEKYTKPSVSGYVAAG
ncbi:MAG: YARHG domain-containing protein [Crocinitomicaceae bacterium]|nr:YARHG domain-containing protein [Crocinitomicaceae bacterium]